MDSTVCDCPESLTANQQVKIRSLFLVPKPISVGEEETRHYLEEPERRFGEGDEGTNRSALDESDDEDCPSMSSQPQVQCAQQ